MEQGGLFQAVVHVGSDDGVVLHLPKALGGFQTSLSIPHLRDNAVFGIRGLSWFQGFSKHLQGELTSGQQSLCLLISINTEGEGASDQAPMELVEIWIGAADLREAFCSVRVGISTKRLSTHEALCPQGGGLAASGELAG